jgi:ubiquinone/menaquinone biosynthesis C-methylase UbiE
MLSINQIRAIYDRLGQRQDSQKYYEETALENLLAHADFESARSVFELGTGTGAFAERLLRQYLPTQARYLGVDLSSVMVALTREKLVPFGERASVYQSEGELVFDIPTATVDRFVSNYVVDLLSEEAIDGLLQEAWRMLTPGGRLCWVSLTKGPTVRSRLVSTVWQIIYRLAPHRVGGCRPLRSSGFVKREAWKVIHRDRVTPHNIPSEILILEKRT